MKSTKTREGYEWWDEFVKVQCYSFIPKEVDGRTTVARVPLPTAMYVEHAEVSELVEAMQEEINRLKEELKALRYAYIN